MIHIFIVNSLVTQRNFRENLKNHLSERKDIRWFVFSTSHAGMEAEIVKKMIQFFDGEKLRFYSCGGSGTFRNIINAVDGYLDYEVAFYPCGATNDFLKVFGEDEQYFKNIDNLIDGRVELLDYIRTNNGIAINTVSFGIDTSICITLDKANILDIFGPVIPSIIAYVKAILFDYKYKKYDLTIDGESTSMEIGEMVVGNGGTLGGNLHFSENPLVTDGKFDYYIANNNHNVSIIKTISMMVKKDYAGVSSNTDNGKASKIEISSGDGRKIDMNLDGEIVSGEGKWEIEIVKCGIQFIVPKQMGRVK